LSKPAFLGNVSVAEL